MRRADATNIDKIRHTFRKYDQDQSDTIDGDELHGLLRDLGHLCTREEAMLIMAGMDPNGDGSVDFAEFLDWWHNAPFSALLM
jgi:calmodulin